MTRYEVVGELPYNGYKPGDEFETDLAPDEEQWALENERVKIINQPKQKGGKDA